ncbi:MAG: hypothetical protein PSN46_06645 [Gammaproteobacteria bacterium]|nr:hypothetical protein [Gammaproteobacteria bacterium]
MKTKMETIQLLEQLSEALDQLNEAWDQAISSLEDQSHEQLKEAA